MVTLKFDLNAFNKQVKDFTDYAEGFMTGIEQNRMAFNQELGALIADIFYRYVDLAAQTDPASLHHVYEWNRVGDPSARLFTITPVASPFSIRFTGSFLPSASTSDTSDTPFVDKANVMENSIDVTISPNDGGVLAFEGDDGEMVFTTEDIYIANPGGDAVAGSFGRVVEEFFGSYLSQGVLRRIFADLETMDEFRGKGGRGAGIMDGRRYYSIKGSVTL
jgi:hypothetical protein